MEGTPSNENNERGTEVQWGADTDYIFNLNVLPRLANSNTPNVTVLAKMFRQKLVHKITQFTGKSPQLHDQDFAARNPLKSNPAAPHFYEWQFTPRYPGFPPRPLLKWNIAQIKCCNNALENGDLYLVDVRNGSPRRFGEEAVASPAIDSGGVQTKQQNRKRLMTICQAAFSRYIVLQTGVASFDFKDILTGDGSSGLLGWKWIFPNTGTFTKFPASNSFWNWSTDEILHALHGLLMKTLRLERLDPLQIDDVRAHDLQDSVKGQESLKAPSRRQKRKRDTGPSRQSRLHGNNHSEPLYIGTSNPGAAAGMNVGSRPEAAITPTVHDLDDLVTQLATRSQQWKEYCNQLQESKAREDNLRTVNAAQASRIEDLEKALHEIERLGEGYTEIGQVMQQFKSATSPMRKDGTEALYEGKITELEAQNEELQEVIKGQEEDVQNSIWLRERNQVLEMQLAEKKSGASSAYRATPTVAVSGPSSIPGGYSTNVTSKYQQNLSRPRPAPSRQAIIYQPIREGAVPSREVKCDLCRDRGQMCINPRGPCNLCFESGGTCTFNYFRKDESQIGDVLTKARQIASSTSQFLQNRRHESPYSAQAGQSRPQLQSQPSMHSRSVSQGIYSPHPLSRPHDGLHEPIVTMSENTKRAATEALSSASKRPATGYLLSAPYLIDDEHDALSRM